METTNDEWIVDGDLYLIKTIGRYPILWDRKNFDSDRRNEVWLKLSKKLNINRNASCIRYSKFDLLSMEFDVSLSVLVEWMKKRWSYLREQYVRHLKQISNTVGAKPSKKTYKYFNEMSFLANHVNIRNSNYQDVILHNVYAPTNETNCEIVATHQMEQDNVVEDEEAVDFIITENEIEAYNEEDDDDNVFVELSDVEEDSAKDQSNQNFIQSSERIPSESVESTHVPTDQHGHIFVSDVALDAQEVQFENVTSLEVEADDPQLLSSVNVAEAQNKSVVKIVETVSNRCEDTIFGEWVTAMLKKMDSPNRKRAKKEILNILLS